MVESTRPVQSRDPFERFDEAISDSRLYDSNQPRLYESSEPRSYETNQPRFESNQPRLYEADHYEQPYALPYERQDTYDRQDALADDLPSHEPVPLFLSNYEDDAHQALSEYAFASGSRKKMRTGRIVTGAIAVSAIAALLALFSIDSTRAVIFNASLGGGSNNTQAQLAAAAPEPAAAPAPVVPQRIAAPPLGAEPSPPPSASPPSAPDVAAARRNSPADAMASASPASASPSRDEITAAYQSALKGKVAVPEPVAREAARETATVAGLAPAVREPVPVTREAAPARRIDPDELAALLKRAKSLLAIGDITSARLLLERAADAQEAEAALMLAGTYDPQVLGSQDMRAVTPDPAAAKVWYQKAAQLGSADAKRRLGQ